MIIAEADENVVGFLSIAHHFGRSCEIHSLGVQKPHQGLGFGAAMVAALKRYAIDNGFSYLSVKTLSDQSDDPHYVATRQFYKGVGFEPFEEFPTLWGANAPCLMMIHKLKTD